MFSLMVSLLLAYVQAAGQPLANQQTGSVDGIVTRAGTSAPLPGTRVGLVKIDGQTATTSAITESDGTFRFTEVPIGLYRVVASRNDGYLPAEYGASRPNARGIAISVSTTQDAKAIQIQMSPTASITGRVLDRDGDPVARAQVVALKAAYDRDGHRSQTIAAAIITNDLGEYRMYWLPPGQYYLTAKVQDPDSRGSQAYIRPPDNTTLHQETSSPVIYTRITDSGETVEEVAVPAYCPGTLDVEAARLINVNSADNVQGVDFNMPEMPRARHIRGTVIDGMTGQPVTSGAVRAIAQNTGPNITIAAGSLNAKGEFDIPGVTTGKYYVFVVVGSTGGFQGGRAARSIVDVGLKDADGISLIAPPPIRIPGKLTVQGAATIDITNFAIQLSPDPNIFGLPSAQPSYQAGLPNPNAVSDDGAFVLSNVAIGDYRLGAFYQVPGVTTYVKSARIGRTDLLLDGLHLDKQPEGELEIVIGTDTGTVSGTVTNDNQDPVVNGIVTLVPDVRARTDLYKSVGTDRSGRFTLRNVPPGDYKLFAWEDIERGAWLDAGYLRDYEARGSVVHVGGAAGSVSLTAIKSRRPQ